jgi:hypothetical protein
MLAGFYPAIFLAEPSLMPMGLVLAYTSAALFGLPLVVLFDRRCWRRWWHYCTGGAVCGLPAVALYALLRKPEHVQAFGLLPATGVMLCAGAAGIMFWMLGVAGDTPVSLRSLFDPLPPRQ